MDQEFAKVVIKGKVESAIREQNIADWLEEFDSTMTKEPGLTSIVDFSIDTGDSRPIAQRPSELAGQRRPRD